MEIKDDSKTTFDEAIGLSTYSNSKAGVASKDDSLVVDGIDTEDEIGYAKV